MIDARLLESLDNATKDCISCGFCESVCPTLPASDYDLSRGARGRVLLGRALYKDLKEKGATEVNVADSFYSCLDCFACVHVCPAGVNAGEVSDIAKEIITATGSPLESQKKNVATMIVNSTMKYGNPLGLRKKAASWSEGLEFDGSSKTLLYTGNMYQLMPFSKSMGAMKAKLGNRAAERIAGYFKSHPQFIKLSGMFQDRTTREEMENSLRNIYALLRKSGADFNYLGEKEPYPGTFLYDLGYMEEFKEYANTVADLFRSEGVRRIITIDPHTHNVLKNNYPGVVKNFDFEIVYYLDLLDNKMFEPGEEDIEYHEPCYFTLREPVYREPEKTLSLAGNVHKPRRSGKNNFCCGGPSELLYPELAHSVSARRREQLEAGRGRRVVTACPICYANLNRDRDVTDIANYLSEHIKG